MEEVPGFSRPAFWLDKGDGFLFAEIVWKRKDVDLTKIQCICFGFFRDEEVDEKRREEKKRALAVGEIVVLRGLDGSFR